MVGTLLFAQSHEDWSGDQTDKEWQNVLWSAENKITLIG